MKKIIYLLVIFLLTGCNHNRSKKNVSIGIQFAPEKIKTIKVNSPKKLWPTNLDQYVFNIEYIELETNKESIIGAISEVIYYDSHYYILDKITSSIFVFNNIGKYVLKINNIGKGNGEFNKLSGFNIDKINQQIVVLTDLPQKVIRYSLNGEYNSELKLPFLSRHVGVLPNKEYAFYLQYRDNSLELKQCYNLITINAKGKMINGFFPYKPESISSNFIKAQNHFYYFNNDLHFYSDLLDVVYVVDNNSIKPKYNIDFGDIKINPDILDENKQFQRDYFKASDEYCILRAVFETKQILYFSYAFKGIVYSGYSSKLNSKTIVYNMIDYKKNLLGNVVGSTDEFLIGEVNQTIMDSKHRQFNIDPNLVNKSIHQIIKNYKITNNPVLVRYEVRL